MALSDFAARQAKATGKDYTLADIDGLCLAVSAEGGKIWHFRYYWAGKQKRISLGTYPEVTLSEARSLRDEARALLAKGINPRVHRKRKRAAVRLADGNTFEVIYKKWFAHRALSLKEGRQTSRGLIPRIFKKDVLPALGQRSIYEITRTDLLDVIAKIEQRGALSVAEKVRTWLNQLFRHALVIVPGLDRNPASDLDVVAQPLPPVNHNPYLRLGELPQMLQRLRRYRGRLRTQLGLRFLFLTGVRTAELRQATPEQFQLDSGLWVIPPDVVKQLQLQMRKRRQRPTDVPPYIVPLCAQAIEIVRYLLDHFEPSQRYLFTHDGDLKKCMSEGTLNTALKRMGYRDLLTGHGIRGTISTALNEIGYPEIWVDAQLSHTNGTYNHAEFVEQRRSMMQDWADRLDLLEQNQVEAASRRLIVHLEGTGTGPVSERSGNTSAGMATASPSLLLAQPAAALPSTVHRLPAVPLPLSSSPPPTDAQRERMKLFDIFEAPHNLTVAAFAKMAGKSRRWISYEVKAGNLLALSVGNRGQRVPDWHLDPLKHALIQAVLKLNMGADGWQIYHALIEPQAALRNRSALDAVTAENLDQVVMRVCRVVKQRDWASLEVA